VSNVVAKCREENVEMTSTVEGDKKLAKILHLGEVDPPELLHVLLDYFNTLPGFLALCSDLDQDRTVRL
jgi:hypothetical protein